ncbi:MAG: acetate/propionate family kinase [Vulcanimicrobiaceae bacterium]
MADVATRTILSFDRGSSSLKVAVYDVGVAHERQTLSGGVEALGGRDATLRMRDCRETPVREECRLLGDASPVAALLARVHQLGVQVDAVGHRLVFGGLAHESPTRVTAELMTSLDAQVPFDPLHTPDALAAIREIAAVSPELPQVVCFDTAFHRRMPMVAQRLPIPRELWSEGVRRYGFHGLSYESIVRGLGVAGTRGKMIVAHLGSGASVAAMRDGRPVDTSMGFSPLGGLMMGTRPGDLDPGALLYLLRTHRYSVEELDEVLTRRSGLLGVSGTSADMRELLERRATDAAAAEAVELFVYQAKKNIGAFVAVLDGLDTLVFTGGIGERAAAVRWEIAQGLLHLGVEIDPARNAASATIISAEGASVVVRVVAAQENLMVARHTYTTLFASAEMNSADISCPPREAEAKA